MSTPRKDPKDLKRPPMPGAGHPLAPIDIAVVERAASIGCSPEEIATVCKISRSTFFQRMKDDPDLADAVERGRDQGRATLRRMQWQGAQKGNPAMLIWLGKQLLGQRDKQEFTGEGGGPILIATGVARATDDGE